MASKKTKRPGPVTLFTGKSRKPVTLTEAQSALTPLAFTGGLVEHLCHVRVTERAIEKAKKFVRERRDLRNEPSHRKGHEYVVERLLRSRIAKYAAHELGIPGTDSHRHIYSSHFHTTSDGQREWRTRWQDFKRAHPEVDTDDDEHSRRADLFISMGKARLVSIEFKYLRAQRKPAVRGSVRQIRQHLTKHDACVLVLYAATPMSVGLESTACEIRDDLRSRNGFVVVITGPSVEFP
jgi:hypothetical protein